MDVKEGSFSALSRKFYTFPLRSPHLSVTFDKQASFLETYFEIFRFASFGFKLEKTMHATPGATELIQGIEYTNSKKGLSNNSPS